MKKNIGTLRFLNSYIVYAKRGVFLFYVLGHIVELVKNTLDGSL